MNGIEVNETCSCGATLNLRSLTYGVLREAHRAWLEVHRDHVAAVEGTAATPEIGTAPGRFPGPGLVGVEQSLKQMREPLNPDHYDRPIGGTAAVKWSEVCGYCKGYPQNRCTCKPEIKAAVEGTSATPGEDEPTDFRRGWCHECLRGAHGYCVDDDQGVTCACRCSDDYTPPRYGAVSAEPRETTT